MKSRAIRELASAHAKLFKILLSDSHGNHIADDNHQHHHSTTMSKVFDITISYEPCSDVNSDVQRTRNARRCTATYTSRIAHRFWNLMHDSPFSAENLAKKHNIPADHMRKLKVLVPFLLPPVNQYVVHNTVLEFITMIFRRLTSSLTPIQGSDWDHCWECITTAPAEILAAYREWIRYDGKSHALTFRSQKMVFVSPVYYHAKSREIFEIFSPDWEPSPKSSTASSFSF